VTGCGTTIEDGVYGAASSRNNAHLVGAVPTLRVPKIFNLRTAHTSGRISRRNTYYEWFIDHVFLLVPAQDYVGQFLATFREYPQRQKAPTFNMDEVLATLKEVSK